MSEEPRWQCANCDTLVEKDDTDRCPTCGHVFFYPVATSVTDSEGSGTVRVEDFDVGEILAARGTETAQETADEDAAEEE